MAQRELRRSVLPLVLLATVVLAATRYAHGSAPPRSSSSEGRQIGKILSIRKAEICGFVKDPSGATEDLVQIVRTYLK